jgi:hypothetical protein
MGSMQSLLVVMLVTSCKYQYDCEREEPLGAFAAG